MLSIIKISISNNVFHIFKESHVQKTTEYIVVICSMFPDLAERSYKALRIIFLQMKLMFSENYDFERTIHTDTEEIIDILIIFNNRKSLLQKINNKILINVKGQLILDLKDKLNPTYDIKLNAI